MTNQDSCGCAAAGATAVPGVTVSVVIADPAGATSTLAGTTASNGSVALGCTMRRRTSPVGTYRITSRATLGSAVSTATATFVLK